MKTLIASLFVTTALAGTAFAKPEITISKKKHPNLFAAQALIDKAYDKIVKAQKANEYDLGGHAQKAKELLEQAAAELKEAAKVSNENH